MYAEDVRFEARVKSIRETKGAPFGVGEGSAVHRHLYVRQGIKSRTAFKMRGAQELLYRLFRALRLAVGLLVIRCGQDGVIAFCRNQIVADARHDQERAFVVPM